MLDCSGSSSHYFWLRSFESSGLAGKAARAVYGLDGSGAGLLISSGVGFLVAFGFSYGDALRFG